jgi:hypothetical protein
LNQAAKVQWNGHDAQNFLHFLIWIKKFRARRDYDGRRLPLNEWNTVEGQ